MEFLNRVIFYIGRGNMNFVVIIILMFFIFLSVWGYLNFDWKIYRYIWRGVRVYWE